MRFSIRTPIEDEIRAIRGFSLISVFGLTLIAFGETE
jgi:hypothetical protein